MIVANGDETKDPKTESQKNRTKNDTFPGMTKSIFVLHFSPLLRYKYDKATKKTRQPIYSSFFLNI